MTTTDERLAQFENMAQADPDNDMAHFSLGNLYLQAGRAAEASRSLLRCLELNPEMSKAYELAGRALIDAGWTDQAVDTLETGYAVAARKGDLMPRNAMADLLKSIGKTPPSLSEADEAAAEEAVTGGTFVCSRTGRTGTKLEDPPMRGPLGEWIQANISAETWRDWIGQGTKVINELRLDLSREDHQVLYDEHMCEYLGIDPPLYKKLTTPQ